MFRPKATNAGRQSGDCASPSSNWWRSTFRFFHSGGERRLTLSNQITIARILILPIFVLFLLQGSYPARGVAAVLFGIASFTDWLDGYLARRRRQITPLGEVLDPVADKLLITSALVPLVALGEVDSWVVGIILGREFLVTAMRAVALRQGRVVAASRAGKIKMALEVAAIIFLILGLAPPMGTVLIWCAMLVALISAADYFRLFYES